MRGEHTNATAARSSAAGSSPHTRGALQPRGSIRPLPGIIPACAGSTWRVRKRSPARWDYPRMRGEHSGSFGDADAPLGSSPHARGALSFFALLAVAAGIIPACAGGTRFGGIRGRQLRDHPRMRGEHSSASVSFAHQMGSSPHARGALNAQGRAPPALGIIPACAGSTGTFAAVLCKTEDHPRMRGEHSTAVYVFFITRGSSPHARGALVSKIQASVAIGIIPACAGSISSSLSVRRSPRDHPRMRGEHGDFDFAPQYQWGSSPHVRGAHVVTVELGLVHGIIPACAGSTCS